MKTLLFLFLASMFIAQAQNNTLQWEEGTVSPPASLTDIAWVSGYWKGEALGGITEEIWSHPLGGSMMGSFKLVTDDRVKFYELCTLNEANGSLILKIKHFDPNLTGWEEKDEVEVFKLIKIEKNRAYFDGITFEKVNPDEINLYVLIEQSGEEMKFNYKRSE